MSAHDKWLKLGTGATATGAAGGGLLVAATPLVYLLRKSDKKRQADFAPSVVVGRQGGSFAIRGTF